jgi:hypothetical protein
MGRTIVVPSSKVEAALMELFDEKREPLKGEGILFGGLWIRDVLAENEVDALVGD